MVVLVPMTEEEYHPWLEKSIREYAEDHIQGGRWGRDNALQESAKEFSELLPNGLATKDNYLFSLYEQAQGQRVGYIWIAVRGSETQQHVYIFDFLIFEPFRRKGLGSQAFRALEDKVRELNLKSIRLHVFGHNDAARAMYTKLGYRETNVSMRKDLSDTTNEY